MRSRTFRGPRGGQPDVFDTPRGTVGGMMAGGMMGMTLMIVLTWLIMLALVGVLSYLVVDAVRARQRAT